jgi:hypothetical protein
MTKKTFIKLAEVIAGIKDDKERKQISLFIGRICADSNGNFRWDKWYKACNVE